MLFNEEEFMKKADARVRNYTGWWYKDLPFEEIPEGVIGFTYRIECINKSNLYYGWDYYGLKNFYSTRNVKLGKKELALQTDKRKKKKKEVVKQSDWLRYNSSNAILKEEIKKNPTHFKKEILGLYSSKKRLMYEEAKLLLCNDVLLKDNNFNSNILGKFYSSEFK